MKANDGIPSPREADSVTLDIPGKHAGSGRSTSTEWQGLRAGVLFSSLQDTDAASTTCSMRIKTSWFLFLCLVFSR